MQVFRIYAAVFLGALFGGFLAGCLGLAIITVYQEIEQPGVDIPRWLAYALYGLLATGAIVGGHRGYRNAVRGTRFEARREDNPYDFEDVL